MMMPPFKICGRLAWIALFIGVLSMPVAAAKRVSIDGLLIAGDGAWIGVGGVRVTQGDLEIFADRMVYEEGAEAYFEGNVRVLQDGSEMLGDAFVYHFEKAEGELTEALAIFEIDALSEPLYMLSERMEFGDGYAVIDDGRLTTCTPPGSAGYYLVSKRMDIFPGDRVVIRNVRFVESGITLFYWPYVVLPLRENAPSRMRFPEIGHSGSDGWYAKLRYAYDGPGSGYGEAAVDLMQRKGIGLGVDHVYRDEPGSEGRITAYRLGNIQTGHDDLRLGWEQSLRLGERTNLNLKAAYLTEAGSHSDEAVERRLAVAFSRVGAAGSTRIDWAGQRFSGDQNGDVQRLRFDHTARPFGLEWRFAGEGYFRRLLEKPLRESLEYSSVLTKRGDGYRLTLTVEEDLHSSLLTDSSSNPAWKRVARLPEVELEYDLSRTLLPLVPIEVRLGYGRFEEVRRGRPADIEVHADRALAAVALKPGNFSLGRLGRFTYSGGAEWRGYSTGDRQLALNANYQLRSTLASRLSFSGTYAYRGLFGDASPFQFDSEREQERATGRLLYSLPRGSLSVSTGYDFLTRRQTDIVGQVSWQFAARSTLSVQGSYSPVSKRPRHVSANARWNAVDNLQVVASARYNFDKESFDRLNVDLTYAYLGWTLRVDTSYDASKDLLQRSDVELVRDLGCREIGLRYDSVDQAVWLEYRITALPGQGLRLGTSEDRFMFDASGFSDLFDDDDE